jgi:imidazole glycerol phosphate synthase glutamine amidotransferase subunit
MPLATDVVIVRTGVANTASVTAALRRHNVEPALSTDPHVIDHARILILPGVGTFAAGLDMLRSAGLEQIIARRISAGRPTLGICLGLQLLAAGSDESPGVRGLEMHSERVTRFAPPVRVPQFGWNRIEPDRGCTLVESGFAYFANSYCMRSCPPGWAAAWADHGGRFVAALERGAVLACQFHLELSGRWGSTLLRRFLDRARQEVLAC